MPTHFSNNNPRGIDADNAYRDALHYLHTRVDHERALSVTYTVEKFRLSRMQRLLELVGNPERGIKIVHVAGTKGKGSTAALISGMMMAASFRVGLFTSPHISRLEERMAVDFQPCSADELVELVEAVRPAVDVMDREAAERRENSGEDDTPTFFEIMTAMGLLLFARRKVDLAVLEVGMGGRLDSTNVCLPVVSVITSISLDHTKQLGDTLAAIAREKAGIVKPGVPVVSGVVEPEPREVIRAVCREQGAGLIELDRDFSFDYFPPNDAEPRCLDYHSASGRHCRLCLGLVGRHQAANAAVALAVIDELRRQGWNIPDAALRRGLAETQYQGRVEVVRRRPLTVIDTAHNVASILALVQALDELHPRGRRVLIFAATQDKDVAGMLGAIRGRFERVIFTRYQKNPRGVPAEELSALWQKIGDCPHAVHQSPLAAWQAARQWAAADGMICIAGSFYIVSELRNTIMNEE